MKNFFMLSRIMLNEATANDPNLAYLAIDAQDPNILGLLAQMGSDTFNMYFTLIGNEYYIRAADAEMLEIDDFDGFHSDYVSGSLARILGAYN